MFAPRVFAVLIVLAAPAVGGAAPVPPAKPPEPLPASVVAAWQKAGAEVGWVSAGNCPVLLFRDGEAGRAGEIPALRVRQWRPGFFVALPPPAQPFGLCL